MRNKRYIVLLLLGVISFNGCIKRDNLPKPYEQSSVYLQSMHPIQESTHAKDWVSISGTSSFFIALKKNGKLFYEGYLPWRESKLLCGTDYIQSSSNPSASARPFKSSVKLKRIDFSDRWSEAYAMNDKLMGKTNGDWMIVERDSSNAYVTNIQSTHVTHDDILKELSKHQESFLKAKIKANGTLWIGKAGKENAFKQETSYAKDWAEVIATYSVNIVALKKDGTLWFWRYPKVEAKKEASMIYENSAYEKTRSTK